MNPFLRAGGNPAAWSLGTPTLVIIESHSATADLLPKNSILLQKVLDDLLLRLVHPSGHGNNHKLKWVQNGAHARRVSLG
jgi:hypothetical protein